MTRALRVVLELVDRINAHDVDGICDRLSAKHVFIDSRGDLTRSREAMRRGWRQYLRAFPDYAIRVKSVLCKGDTVVLLGTARGTYAVRGRLQPGNRWRIPAAWRARVRNGRIAEWQVYADNSPVLRTMERARSTRTGTT